MSSLAAPLALAKCCMLWDAIPSYEEPVSRGYGVARKQQVKLSTDLYTNQCVETPDCKQRLPGLHKKYRVLPSRAEFRSRLCSRARSPRRSVVRVVTSHRPGLTA